MDPSVSAAPAPFRPRPTSPAMKLLAGFLGRNIRRGELVIVDHKGRAHVFGRPAPGWPDCTMRFADGLVPFEMLRDPVMALGEGYMEGRIVFERGDVLGLSEIIRGNTPWEEGGGFARRSGLRARLGAFNREKRAQRNAAHHYDLSDRLYSLFLDRDLHYSCAYFRDPAASLEQAQADKVAHIAAKLALAPGQKLLDIGCGWGAMAIALHRIAGVEVTGITLSERQVETARCRAAEAGVGDHVRFQLLDYRKVEGRFDRIVSIGMFEHVGPPDYRQFFDRCRDLLAPDGVMLLQTVGRLGAPALTDAWIRKYIFPGGHIPALSEIVRASEEARLIASDIETLRLHYALTIRHWYDRATAHRAEIEALYDARFFRMWQFYLAGAIAMFRHGGLCNYQIQYTRSRRALPMTRDYIGPAEERLGAALRG